MAILKKFTKQPIEVLIYDVYFTDWLTALADTALTATVVVDAGTPVVPDTLVTVPLVIDSYSLLNGVVTITASGGEHLVDYKITVTVTTALRTKQDEIVIKVKEY